MTRIRRLILPVVCAVVITGASAAVAREVKHATPGSHTPRWHSFLPGMFR